MENYIKSELVEGICVVFENCEFVYIPSKYLHNLEVKGVSRNKYLSGYDGDLSVRDMTVSNYVNFTVEEYGDTSEILEESMLFTDKYNPYDGYGRLYRSQDITSIEYIYLDGTKEQMYIDYSDEDALSDPNQYQINKPVISKDISRGVNIRIANPENIKKYESVVKGDSEQEDYGKLYGFGVESDKEELKELEGVYL